MDFFSYNLIFLVNLKKMSYILIKNTGIVEHKAHIGNIRSIPASDILIKYAS